MPLAPSLPPAQMLAKPQTGQLLCAYCACQPPPHPPHLLAVVAVHLHELNQVKLGGLEHLDLADGHVLQRVDALQQQTTAAAAAGGNTGGTGQPFASSPVGHLSNLCYCMHFVFAVRKTPHEQASRCISKAAYSWLTATIMPAPPGSTAQLCGALHTLPLGSNTKRLLPELLANAGHALDAFITHHHTQALPVLLLHLWYLLCSSPCCSR